jgi:hypothetical protein
MPLLPLVASWSCKLWERNTLEIDQSKCPSVLPCTVWQKCWLPVVCPNFPLSSTSKRQTLCPMTTLAVSFPWYKKNNNCDVLGSSPTVEEVGWVPVLEF